jgi:hypothetical protein
MSKRRKIVVIIKKIDIMKLVKIYITEEKYE